MNRIMEDEVLGNPIIWTDGYKPSHPDLYPQGIIHGGCYFASRGGAFGGAVLFDLQGLLTRRFTKMGITHEHVVEAKEFYAEYYKRPDVFNADRWHDMIRVCGKDGVLNHLPIRVDALPEGTFVPENVPMFTVSDTHPNFTWVKGYYEPILSHVWYPSTVATQSRELLRIIRKGLEVSGTPSRANDMLQDFGLRGVEGLEAACYGGAANMLYFNGSDTTPACRYARALYPDANNPKWFPGGSIPATEHSLMGIGGPKGQPSAIARLLKKYPTGAIACVLDTGDMYDLLANTIGGEFRQAILDRDGVFIGRPDSGDPSIVLPKALEILDAKFGGRMNEKGYRLINPKVQLLLGDGIELATLPQIIFNLHLKGWSLDNFACFGSGGGLLQKVNRDTAKIAFKLSYVVLDEYHEGSPEDIEYDVWKDPITDPGKTSLRGPQGVFQGSSGELVAARLTNENRGANLLDPVYIAGKMDNIVSYSKVREIARAS